MIDVREISHGSELYLAAVELRREVLRRPLGLDFTPEQLRDEASDRHLAALASGEVVGTLILTPRLDDSMQMRQVAVHPLRQRMGIGIQMVHFAELTARISGVRRIILHARDTAVPFYLALGYELEGEPFTEVSIPHRSMFRTL